MPGMSAEDRYYVNIRNQERILSKFAAQEIEYAEYLTMWYGMKKEDMPDDEYRACAFFLNREYLHKPGSLTLCYETFQKWTGEFTVVEKEMAFDLLRYRYKAYAHVLAKGGFS